MSMNEVPRIQKLALDKSNSPVVLLSSIKSNGSQVLTCGTLESPTARESDLGGIDKRPTALRRNPNAVLVKCLLLDCGCIRTFHSGLFPGDSRGMPCSHAREA